MVIDKRDSMDRFALNDGAIPDPSHIEIIATVSRFLEIVVQGNVKETELCIESVDIVGQIIKRVLPEFTERKQVWLARFAAHSSDKVCYKFPVDMLDGIEPKTASIGLFYYPFTPLNDIAPGVWMTVLNI
jgi:hypothetical protein